MKSDYKMLFICVSHFNILRMCFETGNVSVLYHEGFYSICIGEYTVVTLGVFFIRQICLATNY